MQKIIHSIIESSTDVSEASRKLEMAALKDRALRDYLTEPYLTQACYNAARSEYRAKRQQIWTAPNYTKGGNGQRVKNHAASLLDFPLPNGKRLRDAKAADLLEAAEFYRKQASNMAHKARWLDAIAAKIGRKKVSTVFNDQSLIDLKAEDQSGKEWQEAA